MLNCFRFRMMVRDPDGGQGAAFEVEFMTLDGGTLAIETLEASQVREAGSCDVPHLRERIAA